MIQIFPFSFHFDIGLINPPIIAGTLAIPFNSFMKFCRIFLNPSIYCRIIYFYPSFLHHFLQITIAYWVFQIPFQIPSHTSYNNLSCEMPIFKICSSTYKLCFFIYYSLNFLFYTISLNCLQQDQKLLHSKQNYFYQ